VTAFSPETIQNLLDEQAIRAVLHRYCRGIDRRQFDLVRSCYHPDGWDDHGAFRGGVEGFIEHCRSGLARYERTMHFMGNMFIEVSGHLAKAETYTIAFHRVPARNGKPPRDHLVGFRYVDDFERRGGEWRIKKRVCAFEWTRTDPVPEGWDFPPDVLRGIHGSDDTVFAAPQ